MSALDVVAAAVADKHKARYNMRNKLRNGVVDFILKAGFQNFRTRKGDASYLSVKRRIFGRYLLVR
jgi:hypothetical protein